MTKKQAWDYAIGIIKVDGLKPTNDFMKMVDKEIKGELTTLDIEKALNKKYRMKTDSKKQ